jgi:hypothetical protein
MGDKAWKAFERRMAAKVGGKRRGAYTRDERGGKSDIIHPHFSIECKLLSRPSFGEAFDACQQAERNAEPHQEPIAILKRKGDRDDDAMVCMTLKTWLEWHA